VRTAFGTGPVNAWAGGGAVVGGGVGVGAAVVVVVSTTVVLASGAVDVVDVVDDVGSSAGGVADSVCPPFEHAAATKANDAKTIPNVRRIMTPSCAQATGTRQSP